MNTFAPNSIPFDLTPLALAMRLAFPRNDAYYFASAFALSRASTVAVDLE